MDIFVRHTFRMSKNNIKTKTVLTLDSKAEKRKYVSDVLKANGYTKAFLRNCQKPVTTNSLLMKGKQRLVLLLFLTFRVLRNPSREFWTALTLKLQKNLFRLWGIFLPNLRVLSGKTNEPTPFIVFLAMTVTTNTSDRPNVSLVDVWKSMKKRFSFFFLQKKKIQLYRTTHAQLPIQLGGINLKLSPLLGVTTSAFVWKLGILTPPTLL